MKRRIDIFRQRYLSALRAHLAGGRLGGLKQAHGFGSQALTAGFHTLDLSRFHEDILISEFLPACPAAKRGALIKRAAIFFATAVSPIEKAPNMVRETTFHLLRFIESLSRRTVELASLNLELTIEIAQRKAVEKALKKSELKSLHLLTKSNHLQEQLRLVSREIISSQEDERKSISRELHDVIAQTLTGINIRLAALKREAAKNTAGIDHNITLTQELVQNSVNIVHEFARELRPAVLDDLGLIPALHSFMKNFTARTGVHTHLAAFRGIETMNINRRTVLFRVAQEALTNVARHAKSSTVTVKIAQAKGLARMTITDNGKSFNVQRVLDAKGSKHLGLLGMRERMEMIDGTLAIVSAPGKGTMLTAMVPFSADHPGNGAPPKKHLVTK
jgi:signal transduction histidine kinase